MLDAIEDRLAGALGRERLERLHRATVAVIGAGLLGGQLVFHLALLQIRTKIVECGIVELPNLGNQFFGVAALGKSKSEARALQVRELNPSCPLVAVPARVEELGLGFFADCDLLLTGLDGRASRLAVGRIAQRLGIDWIDAALDGSGERLLGTVSWYRPRAGANACYGCRYDAAQLAAIARETRKRPQAARSEAQPSEVRSSKRPQAARSEAQPSGATRTGCASWRDPALPSTPPTLAASPFGAVVAGMQMLWAMQALLGEGEELVNHQLQIAGGGTPRMRTVELARSRHCAFPHEPLPLQRTPCATPGALLELAERDLGAAPEALVFPDRTLALGLGCPSCGARRELVKCRESFGDDEVRCACGAPDEMLPRALSHRLDAERARALADLEWHAFGLPAGDLASAVAGERTAHYLLPGGAPGPSPAEGTI